MRYCVVRRYRRISLEFYFQIQRHGMCQYYKLFRSLAAQLKML